MIKQTNQVCFLQRTVWIFQKCSLINKLQWCVERVDRWMDRCVARLYRKRYDSLKQIKWSPQKQKTLTGTLCVDEASALALQPPPTPKNRAAPITKQHRCSFQHSVSSHGWFSPALRVCHGPTSDRPTTWCERGREDVAHLPLRVPTLLALTCDLTNSQSCRNSSRGTLSWRFYFYHPEPRSLPPPPSTPSSFMRKRLALQKHRTCGRADWCSWRCVTECTHCFFLCLFFPFLRFRGPVWRWWHPVTNAAAAAGIMDDGHTSPHLNVFFVLFSPSAECKPII